MNNYDVAIITKTWFTDTSITTISGYDLYKQNRISQTKGGGVCIYVKQTLISHEIHDKTLNDKSIKQGSENILAGCIYRPNNSTDILTLRKSILKSKLMLEQGTYTGVLIAGDFNFFNMSWVDGDNIKRTSSKSDEIFTESLRDCYFYQHVDFPTFLIDGESSSKNTLDLIITETVQRIYTTSKLPPLDDLNRTHIGLEWYYELSACNYQNNKFTRSN
jgi:hypothetical protein